MTIGKNQKGVVQASEKYLSENEIDLKGGINFDESVLWQIILSQSLDIEQK